MPQVMIECLGRPDLFVRVKSPMTSRGSFGADPRERNVLISVKCLCYFPPIKAPPPPIGLTLYRSIGNQSKVGQEILPLRSNHYT